MKNIKFTKNHYYLIIENDSIIIGLTDYIVDKIGKNINSIELPTIYDIYKKNDIVGTVYYGNEELSIYTPITGEIAEINEVLLEEPENIKNSSTENSWLFKVYSNNIDEIEDELMTEEEYESYIENL